MLITDCKTHRSEEELTVPTEEEKMQNTMRMKAHFKEGVKTNIVG